jgi:hypothetical protein
MAPMPYCGRRCGNASRRRGGCSGLRAAFRGTSSSGPQQTPAATAGPPRKRRGAVDYGLHAMAKALGPDDLVWLGVEAAETRAAAG